MSNIITPNEPTQTTFQDTPATPQTVQQALAMLDRYEQLLNDDAAKLATPGNPNPEKAVNDLGGVIAGFLFNNARTLLQNHQICQMEYVPLVRGLHAALARGPFAHQIAQAVVGGFAAMSAERAQVQQNIGDGISNEQEKKS